MWKLVGYNKKVTIRYKQILYGTLGVTDSTQVVYNKLKVAPVYQLYAVYSSAAPDYQLKSPLAPYATHSSNYFRYNPNKHIFSHLWIVCFAYPTNCIQLSASYQ